MLRFIGLFFSCLCFCLFVCVGCSKNNISSDVNLNSGVVNIKLVDGLKIQNVSLVSKGSDSLFVAFVTNETQNTIYVSKIKAVMKDFNDNEITSVFLNVDKNILPNESVEMSAVFGMDLMNVDNIVYEIVY